MTLEGAINLNETNDYIIYTMNSVTTGQYGVVVPKNIGGTLKMLVDLHMKSSFDGIASGTKTREQLVSEISDEYSKLKGKYNDGMLVMPMIDEAMFKGIVVNGDKQKMFDEVKKIGAITSELYKKLTEQGIDKQRIDQKIIIVEKIEEDIKFVSWLKEQMPNFVEGLSYNELNNVQVNANPFVDSNSIFGPALSNEPVVEQAPVNPSVENTFVSNPVSGGIFDNVTPVSTPTPAPVVEPVQPVTPVEPVVPNNLFGESTVSANPQASNDIFGNPVSAPVAPQQPPVVETPVATPAVDNVFGPAVSSGPVEQASVQQPVQPVAQNTTPVVEGPKPVENTSLESTMTFSAINEQQPSGDISGEATAEGDGAPARSKSQGFVNLLILVVILVGVTIVSIEIGKYLYSVYGA